MFYEAPRLYPVCDRKGGVPGDKEGQVGSFKPVSQVRLRFVKELLRFTFPVSFHHVLD